MIVVVVVPPVLVVVVETEVEPAQLLDFGQVDLAEVRLLVVPVYNISSKQQLKSQLRAEPLQAWPLVRKIARGQGRLASGHCLTT